MTDLKAVITGVCSDWANDPDQPDGDVLYERLYLAGLERGRKDERMRIGLCAGCCKKVCDEVDKLLPPERLPNAQQLEDKK